MSTNDHTVPQMYLRRFAELRAGRGHFIVAAPVDDLDSSFNPNIRNVAAVKGFYWGTTPDGVDHHTLELLLQAVENGATPAFRAMLDAREGALPEQWPMPAPRRMCLAWWIAAQILRTTRQRIRLASLAEAEGLEAPRAVGRFTENNPHIAYVAQQLAGLALVIYRQPWAIGFSDVCLLTSDVPVVILNGQDQADQSLAAWHHNTLLPLDPHRFLLLPGQVLLDEDPRKRRDHRMKLPGGVGLAFNEATWAAASRQVFYHPAHNPIPHMMKTGDRGPRLPAPGEDDGNGPYFMFSYAPLDPHWTVERRWLREHPAPPPDLRDH